MPGEAPPAFDRLREQHTCLPRAWRCRREPQPGLLRVWDALLLSSCGRRPDAGKGRAFPVVPGSTYGDWESVYRDNLLDPGPPEELPGASRIWRRLAARAMSQAAAEMNVSQANAKILQYRALQKAAKMGGDMTP